MATIRIKTTATRLRRRLMKMTEKETERRTETERTLTDKFAVVRRAALLLMDKFAVRCGSCFRDSFALAETHKERVCVFYEELAQF